VRAAGDARKSYPISLKRWGIESSLPSTISLPLIIFKLHQFRTHEKQHAIISKDFGV
jgi:hypothetical protein